LAFSCQNSDFQHARIVFLGLFLILKPARAVLLNA
jgi:hypothetical protein